MLIKLLENTPQELVHNLQRMENLNTLLEVGVIVILLIVIILLALFIDKLLDCKAPIPLLVILFGFVFTGGFLQTSSQNQMKTIRDNIKSEYHLQDIEMSILLDSINGKSNIDINSLYHLIKQR